MLEDYEKQVNKIIEELNTIKGIFFLSFMQESEIDSQILNTYSKNSEKQVNFIFESLNNPKRLDLLFRAS